MEETTLRQLRGLTDLIEDAVGAGVTQTERMHVAIARYPYAVLERVTPIAAPVRGVEFVQATITGSVYWTVRLATRVTAVVAARALDEIEARSTRQKR
jgi:hypothetical protein